MTIDVEREADGISVVAVAPGQAVARTTASSLMGVLLSECARDHAIDAAKP